MLEGILLPGILPGELFLCPKVNKGALKPGTESGSGLFHCPRYAKD